MHSPVEAPSNESSGWNWKFALKPCPGHSELATNSM